MVLDNDKDVVIALVHGDIDECTIVEDLLEDMAFEFQENKNVVFGYFNWKYAEMEGIFPPRFPSVLLFPGHQKNHKYHYMPWQSYEDLTKSAVINFIKDYGK